VLELALHCLQLWLRLHQNDAAPCGSGFAKLVIAVSKMALYSF
jgi:hypothetical protein